MLNFFKSLAEQEESPVVICDLQHTILYMNPVACLRYEKYGADKLLGKNLLDCHNPASAGIIRQVVDWFGADPAHNRVHTGYNEKDNRDIYMIALRDEENTLIGYYEKHISRNRDLSKLYDMPGKD